MTVCTSTHFPKLSWLQCDSMLAGQDSHRLGGAVLGLEQGADGPAGLPMQQVRLPLLGESSTAISEIWSSSGLCIAGEAHGIRYRNDGRVIYGVVDLGEIAGSLAERGELVALTENAYTRLFALLEEQNFPYLWRVWNYLPVINLESAGLERYRQFNVGRQNAFMASGRVLQGSVPAACALGVGQGGMSISFMAGRVAPRYLENPRQVSAFDYPPEYGPRSPTFSRAVLLPLTGQEILFISGTSSILGHETVHSGDVMAQTRETICNISALLDEASKVTEGSAYTPGELSYRVYIRHAADFAAVRDILHHWIGPDSAVVYIQADVCRTDLLVEIEAMSVRDLSTAAGS